MYLLFLTHLLYFVSVHRDELNFLFTLHQTVSDVDRGWILVNKDQHRQLKSLQEKGSKKEVISLRFYLKSVYLYPEIPFSKDASRPQKILHLVLSVSPLP